MRVNNYILEFLLWHSEIGSISGALGGRFKPQPDTVGSKQLQLESDPWPRNSICCGAKTTETNKKYPKHNYPIFVLSFFLHIENFLSLLPTLSAWLIPFLFFFVFLFFCYFFEPLPRHMEVPRLGV